MSEINLFFSDEFKQRLRTLAKRYRNIRKDLQPHTLYNIVLGWARLEIV